LWLTRQQAAEAENRFATIVHNSDQGRWGALKRGPYNA